MKRSQIFDRIKDIIYAKISIELLDTEDLKEDQDLFNDLGFDSLDVVELIMECEKFFNIDIKDGDIEEITTIKDVIDYLEVRIN